MTIDDQNLSELMKVIRRQLSLSQEDLARALGISFPTVNRWENSLVRSLKLTIEKENPTLKGVLPKDYSRPSLDKYRLGELIDIISKIGLGDDESRSKDILGRVCGYFLGRFAAAEDSLGVDSMDAEREANILRGGFRSTAVTETTLEQTARWQKTARRQLSNVEGIG